MIRFIKYVSVLMVLLALAAGAALGGVYWWFNQPRVTMQEADMFAPVLFEVPRGTHGRQLTAMLAEQGYIEHQRLNYWAARLFLDADTIRAGVYAIHPADSPRSIWQRISAGQQHQFQVTFIEGSEFSQWLAQLERLPYLERQISDLSNAEIIAKLDPDSEWEHPEGLFFPDTYRYTAGTTDLQLLRKARSEERRV